ncbi:MAG TPA: HNH endonuclease, partial [Planctomycetota bacterium]|nr:HNH endonuclease [Planctomycetota bacterium]
ATEKEAAPKTTDGTPRIVPPSERDRPNSTAFSQKVKRRDGNRCLNCGKRVCLQAHHIVYREHGGRTEQSNSMALCAVCHALVHEGRLGLEGDVFSGFRFFPRHECMRVSLKEIGEKLRLSKISGVWMSGVPDSASGIPDSGPGDGASGFDVELLASGLVNIGYREKDAIEAISRAIERLASDSTRSKPITEQDICKEAVRRGGRR